KLIKGSKSACQGMNAFDRRGRSKILDDLNLGGVSSDASLTDHVSEELSRLNSESTFPKIKNHGIITKNVEYFLKMMNIVGNFYRFDKHVVDINFHSALDHTREHLVNKTLVHNPNILQPKRHHVVALFCDYHPEKFSDQGDPRIVDEWVQGLEIIFEVMNCPDRYRMLCAKIQLTGDARLWWQAYWSMRPGEKDGCAWDQFKELIREKYYPSYYRADMERQFLALTQGTRSVDEYEREFTRLGAF
ncbi:Unknown protein, partial [Striga hermonthica]